MKAIVIKKYGHPLDVLQLRDVEKPTPEDNRVLVKVYAASVNPVDLAPIKGAFLARLLGTGFLKPKRSITGTDIAGRVEAVGKNVKQFKPGDEVFGGALGGFAEYASAREDLLALKPANVTFEEAAAVPVAAITALQGLRKGQIQAGHKVLVYGASGGVGQFAVQIAKSFGTEVTAVCSTKNLDNARSMGADHVIDYTQEDFTRNGQKYDLIAAANGYHSILDYRNALSPKGTYIVLGGSLTQLFQALLLGQLLSKNGGKKMGFMGIAALNQKDLVFIKELLEAGKIKPVIDRRYPFIETPEAVQYLIEGHAKGKVIIEIQSERV
jgi:NADPH:quinone reductase-like Zn-dependent oxidoreductase